MVTSYLDKAAATMVNTPNGGGHFIEATLKPEITISGKAEKELLEYLHHQANKLCYIANSCNFPVRHEPVYHYEE